MSRQFFCLRLILFITSDLLTLRLIEFLPSAQCARAYMTMKRVRTGECHAISMNGDYVCFRKKKYTEPFISLRHSNAAETKPLSRLQSTRMFTRGPVNPSTLPHMRYSCSSYVVEALTSFSPPEPRAAVSMLDSVGADATMKTIICTTSFSK